jgi:hypothetical protein
MRNDSPATVRIPHRRTGRPRGGKPGNVNALKHGLDSAAALAHRRAFAAMLREVRAAIKAAD